MIKKVIMSLFTVLVLMLLTSCEKGNALEALSWYVEDIDGDGNNELLCITGHEDSMVTDDGEKYGSNFDIYKVYTVEDDSVYVYGEPTYSFDMSDLKPMFIQTGDIEGDGIKEIAICVYKNTRYHSEDAKRPFFYALNEGTLKKVWLGSRLSRPFSDYLLYDIDEDSLDEIISLEDDKDGRQLIAVYDWSGFGFEQKAASEALIGEAGFLFPRHEAVEKPTVIIQKTVGANIESKVYEIALENGVIGFTCCD